MQQQEGPYLIRCAMSNGKGWQVFQYCKTAQEWHAAQQRFYLYSLSGGNRFQKLIHMNYDEMKRAEQAAIAQLQSKA